MIDEGAHKKNLNPPPSSDRPPPPRSQCAPRSSGIKERLRREGGDAFSRHFSLGMWKLCEEAAQHIERLEKELEDERAKHRTDLLSGLARDDANHI